MDRFRCTLYAASALLLAALPLVAQPLELELTCRPEHGLLDQRQVRPRDVRGHASGSTYYLFDNPQLFEMRVSLTNLSPSPWRVADVAGDWVRALRVRVERGGATLSPDEVRIEPVRRLRRALVYYKDGKPVEEPRFVRKLASPGPEPLMAYDESRREEQDVDDLPHELATYEEAVVVFRLRAAGGGDLPLGLYKVSVADEANHLRCGDKLVVMRAPRSPLDSVDAHVVRAAFDQAQGDLEAAADEMARATRLAPDVLKGWVYRSAIAVARNDLAGQTDAANHLEELLTRKAGADPEDFVGVLRDAKTVAYKAPELRRRLAAKEAAEH